MTELALFFGAAVAGCLAAAAQHYGISGSRSMGRWKPFVILLVGALGALWLLDALKQSAVIAHAYWVAAAVVLLGTYLGTTFLLKKKGV